MHAAALRLELRIPGVQSLKGKRRVVKAITAELRNAFGVAVAEVDRQDAWQRATIGVALVASDHSGLDRAVGAIHQRMLDRPDAELVEMGVAYLEEGP